MAKKKKTGGRRSGTQKKEFPTLLEFARAHQASYPGEAAPEDDEECVNKAFKNVMSNMESIAQSQTRDELLWEEALRDLSEIISYHVEWNMMNPSALRDARRLIPKDFRRMVESECKYIRERGGDPGEVRTIYRLNALHTVLNEIIPNEAWERATDQLAANELEGKKGKRRWDDVSPEDKGCITPFLAVNYMLHSYCSALNERYRDVGDMKPEEVRKEMLQNGDVYIVTVSMTSVTGLQSNLHSTQYANTEDGAYNRAELQAARVKMDPAYTDAEVVRVVTVAEGCEVEEQGEVWVAHDPSGRSEGKGATKEEAIEDLRMRVLARLTPDLEKERPTSEAN